MAKTQLSSQDFEKRVLEYRHAIREYTLGKMSLPPESSLHAAYTHVIGEMQSKLNKLIASQKPVEIVYNEDEWE